MNSGFHSTGFPGFHNKKVAGLRIPKTKISRISLLYMGEKIHQSLLRRRTMLQRKNPLVCLPPCKYTLSLVV